jgi:very-short-patch-repair endonuclease
MVTTPARTIADLRRIASPKLVRRAIRQAEYDHLQVGEHARETERTRSDVESRFLRLCRRHGLPKPEVNVPIGRFTVDFLWRTERLVVETDAYHTHRGYQAFIDDRERDNELMALGLEVLRFTDLRIDKEPARVAVIVRARLNAAPIQRLAVEFFPLHGSKPTAACWRGVAVGATRRLLRKRRGPSAWAGR